MSKEDQVKNQSSDETTAAETTARKPLKAGPGQVVMIAKTQIIGQPNKDDVVDAGNDFICSKEEAQRLEKLGAAVYPK